jgi:lipopolysaccharide transport system ATP-binding protein
VHVEPDVLIVDEALSVGDARFQAKALTKIEEILKCGTTLLFVGHDLSAVRAFCNQAMLLDKGRIIKAGIPDDVIADYLYIVQKDRIAELGSGLDLKRKGKGFTLQDFDIVEARFAGMEQHATLAFGMQATLDIDIQMTTTLQAPFLIVDVIDNRGMQLTGKRIAVPSFQGVRRVAVSLQCSFQKGIYRLRLRLVNAPSLEQTLLMSRYDDLLSIEMIDDVRDKFTGLFPIPMDVTWSEQVVDAEPQ